MSYLHKHGTLATPQSEALRPDQVENSAGGHVWGVDAFMRLRRFLILGSEGGSYYASEHDLTKENVTALRECIASDGARTVQEIVTVSQEGRAPKNDPAIFALALCVAEGDEQTKKEALDVLPQVCRIGTHLFTFVSFLDGFGKLTGRAKRRAIAGWYTEKPVDVLAYQLVKYRQRGGWSHRDLLRLAHPARKVSAGNPTSQVSDGHAELFSWVARGQGNLDKLPDIIEGFELAQNSPTPQQTATLVREYRLPREALTSDHLRSPEVWDAMLDSDMPITALIRNLANMTRTGVCTPTSEGTKKVVAAIEDTDKLRKGRVHPLSILVALKTYAAGRGHLSRGEGWAPVARIVDALDRAFYLTFRNVEPTGKRLLLGLDVSGSMGSPIAGTMLTMRDAAAAMALVTTVVEPQSECVAFASGGFSVASSKRHMWYEAGVVPFPLSGRERLDDVIAKMNRLPFGGTDCALPMLYAQAQKREVDGFVVYTDSETWAGDIHPKTALDDYRRSSGIDACSVVVGMEANDFTIADPLDPGMLDVVGFDTGAPAVISDFVAGR